MSTIQSADPTHIAIIMDGNGRWAEQRGKSRIFGHRRGVEAVRNVVDACGHRGIPYLTLYAFSSENWNRPREEVRLLTELLFTTLESEAQQLHDNGIRLRVIGDLTPFGETIDRTVREVQGLTKGNKNLNLTVAVNYGGRWDIANACKKVADAVQNNSFLLSDITEQAVADKLSTAELPEPDLFIRTGGEIRVSNFLLWQIAYSELVFIDTLWPEFDESCLDQALESYRGRQRRFGKSGEGLSRQ
jgi:undecaprenyl diphosphate synthase